MNFVDEQDIPFFQIGKQRRKVTRLGDHRSGGCPEVDPKLARHDLGECRLAEARRADEQHMVQRFAARLCRSDEDLQIGTCLGLTDEIVERLGPHRAVDLITAYFRRYDTGFIRHG